MFVSNTNHANNDSISYPDRSFDHFHNLIFSPNSKQQHQQEDYLHLPISFFHFPSPFDDDTNDVFLHPHEDLLLHHLQESLLMAPGHDAVEREIVGSDSKKSVHVNGHITKEKHIQRKRSSKRDRHSKINTLRGPRDRRMRLSLPVAREFFGLQDMLGVDKASKTVEWLLIQSSPAIEKLEREVNYHGTISSVGATKCTSSLSECEVVSGIDEVANKEIQQGGRKASLLTREKKSTKQCRKTTVFHPVARESREKARARARARTEEKQQNRKVLEVNKYGPNPCHDAINHEINRLSSTNCPSPFENGEESGTQSHTIKNNTSSFEEPISSHQEIAEQFGTIDQNMIDDCNLMSMNKWSPSSSSIFYYMQNNGMTQEHQFGDFQYIGKPWEAYTNGSLC